MANQSNNDEPNKIPWKLFGRIFLAIVAIMLVFVFGWQVKSVSILGFGLEPPATVTISPPTTALQPNSANPNVINGQILLTDNFDDSSTRGYNPDMWSCNNCDVGNVSNENDTIQLEVNGANLALNLSSKTAWLSSQINYLSGKLSLTKDEKNGNGTVDLSLHTTLASKLWQVGCLISPSQFSLNQAEFGCEMFTVNPQQQWHYEYRTPSTVINYSEWHEAKIEINPKTLELSFYLDNKLIGQHTPADANELKSMKLTAQMGIYTYDNKDGHLIANIDDVLVAPAK
jgi:hypothetical protein